MNEEMKDLVAATEEAERVVVVTGAVRGLCIGGDLSSPMYQSTDAAEIRKGIIKFGKLLLNLRNMPKPVITPVNCDTVAAGLSFSLAADTIFASGNAKFGHICTKYR